MISLLENEHGWWHLCPGCEKPHRVPKGAGWSFSGDMVKPTFTPSVLHTWPGLTKRCHYFIRGGRIEFCADSTHRFGGQTVDLPDASDALAKWGILQS